MTTFDCLYTFVHSIVHSAARGLGYTLVRSHRVPKSTLNALDIAVELEVVRSGENFMFVQIGANDGVKDDPLRPLVCKWHLRGLLVEPLPDVYAALLRNYAAEPQLLFENCAITEQDGETSLYRPIRSDGHTLDGLSSLSPMVSRQRSVFSCGVVGEAAVTVRAMTMSSLLRKHKIGEISLLVVDTEGHDWSIVRQMLRGPVRPRLILFEHVWLSSADRLESRKVLSESGYHYAESSQDTLAILHGCR